MRLKKVINPKPQGSYERSFFEITKKCPSAPKDIHKGLAWLQTNEAPIPYGKTIVVVPGIAKPVIKIPIGSSDMKRGKRGSFRVLLSL